MKFGYVRLNNKEMEQELQLDGLKGFGCETIFVDEDPHDKNQIPAKLINIADQLQKGDVIVVWKLDLLGLSLIGLIEFVSSFRHKGVEFVSLKDDIDTETEIGRFTFKILASQQGF